MSLQRQLTLQSERMEDMKKEHLASGEIIVTGKNGCGYGESGGCGYREGWTGVCGHRDSGCVSPKNILFMIFT